MFGELVRQYREPIMSLRKFAGVIGQDHSNWSKVERGVLPPPQSKKLVADITKALKISKEEHDQLCLHMVLDGIKCPELAKMFKERKS